MSRGRREEVIPSAARLLGSLRDVGYDFVNAVADLIDNSVSHGATGVDVVLRPQGADSWVRIADNGVGMSGAIISEAMRLGSGGRTYSDDELGKFGLGLKTASLSQARSITVASRTHRERRQIECRRLDLDDIEATDRWEIEHLAAADRPEIITEPLRASTGTVVLWTKLDRVLDFNDPFGTTSQRYMLRLAERLDQHLGMVFERFLSGQARRALPLAITVNGTKVEPWDPFCLAQNTEHLPVHELRVGAGLVRYRPYVLPPQTEFGDDESWRRASGPNQWNRQQGLYIYRADRMVQSGGWSWLRGNDEHIKLARAAVEFWPDLDEAFSINVAKTRVKLPEDLRDQLKPLVASLTRRADERYRRSSPRRPRPVPSPRPAPAPEGRGDGARGRPTSDVGSPADQNPGPSSAPTPPASSSPAPTSPAPTCPTPSVPWGGTPATATQGPTDTQGPTVDRRIGDLLEEAARRLGHEAVLKAIRAEVRARYPEVARGLGW